MDINELFDGIAEAFRQYQAEMAEQSKASVSLTPTGLEPLKKPEKTEKIMPTEKGVEQITGFSSCDNYPDTRGNDTSRSPLGLHDAIQSSDVFDTYRSIWRVTFTFSQIQVGSKITMFNR